MTAAPVFVMLGWDSALYAPVLPVGVFGYDPGSAGLVVSWLPLSGGAADPWRGRIAGCGERGAVAVADWEQQPAGTLDLVEVPAPADATDLRGAVEIVVDELLSLPILAGGD